MEAFGTAYDLPDETCREQKFALLRKAVAADKPQLIRLSALQSLADYDDPRVAAALRALTADRDQTVRQLATERLRELAP
jgi:HEAT repeat protein